MEKTRRYMLSGEIDHHSSARLRMEMDALIEKERPRILILDFRYVRLMDSSGIGLLLGRYKYMKEMGGRIMIANTDKRIDRILSLSGIYKIIEKA